MTDNNDTIVITTVEELLAHSLALETEAAERYDEVADNLEVHNNLEVAELFRRLAGYGRKHAAEMEALAKGRDIPHIAPWDFKWPAAEPPEAVAPEDIHYLMNPHQALNVAREVERKARDFYQGVADAADDPEVKRLAAEFAAEETEHVELLDEWIKRHPEPERNWDYDPDPPFMPE